MHILKPLPGTLPMPGRPLADAVGLWPMNEKGGKEIFDLSGNGNTGRLVGDTHFVVPGKVGSALAFDGTGDFVQTINSVPTLEIANVTLVVYAKSPDWSRMQVVIWKHRASESDQCYYIRTNGNVFVGGIFADAGYSVTGSIPLVNNFGYHLALTYDGETLKCYVNGIFDNQNTTPSGDLQTGTRSLCLGAKGNSANPFLGLFDYAKVWNRALSAYEIGLDCREPFCMFPEPIMPEFGIAA